LIALFEHLDRRSIIKYVEIDELPWLPINCYSAVIYLVLVVEENETIFYI